MPDVPCLAALALDLRRTRKTTNAASNKSPMHAPTTTPTIMPTSIPPDSVSAPADADLCSSAPPDAVAEDFELSGIETSVLVLSCIVLRCAMLEAIVDAAVDETAVAPMSTVTLGAGGGDADDSVCINADVCVVRREVISIGAVRGVGLG